MKINTSSMAALDRSNGVETYLSVIKEINDCTIPSLEGFSELIRIDKDGKKLTKELDRVLGGQPSLMWPDRVVQVLRKHTAKESQVEDLINEHVPKSIEIEQLDSRTAQIAAYINNLSFFSEMIRKVAMVELNRLAKLKGRKVSSTMSPAEEKEVLAELEAVISTYRNLSSTADVNFSKAIGDMPEFTVADMDDSVVAATFGAAKTTPIAQNFFSAALNPILAIRSYLNQRLIKRYHVAKEQRQALEYRIQALMDSRDGTENPKLDKIIEYHTGQLKRIQLELTRIEEKAK